MYLCMNKTALQIMVGPCIYTVCLQYTELHEPTYALFVDQEKAFDWLTMISYFASFCVIINAKMYSVISSLYKYTSCIMINAGACSM